MKVNGQLHSRRKSPQYLMDRRLGEPQVGMHAVRKRKLLPCQESNPGCPAHGLSLYYPGNLSFLMIIFKYMCKIRNIRTLPEIFKTICTSVKMLTSSNTSD
jgi:hypothetical protein